MTAIIFRTNLECDSIKRLSNSITTDSYVLKVYYYTPPL